MSKTTNDRSLLKNCSFKQNTISKIVTSHSVTLKIEVSSLQVMFMSRCHIEKGALGKWVIEMGEKLGATQENNKIL